MLKKEGFYATAVRELLTSPKFITISIAIIALLVIPFTLIEIQSQQSLRQNAESILWYTTQSASSACSANGAVISATFINTEARSNSTAMNVIVKDNQTGQSVNMGSIQGGASKTVTIETGKTNLSSGTVTFALSWTDGHSGTDSRTASYQSVYNCKSYPTPTPTKIPTPTPTLPPGTPTPTICPTLEPVQNVHIDCPNCKLSPTP